MKFSGPAEQLADMMIKLSTKYYATEWMMGLEFELWTSEEANELKDMAEFCGGWITMNFQTNELEFATLENWRKTFYENNPY